MSTDEGSNSFKKPAGIDEGLRDMYVFEGHNYRKDVEAMKDLVSKGKALETENSMIGGYFWFRINTQLKDFLVNELVSLLIARVKLVIWTRIQECSLLALFVEYACR